MKIITLIIILLFLNGCCDFKLDDHSKKDVYLYNSHIYSNNNLISKKQIKNTIDETMKVTSDHINVPYNDILDQYNRTNIGIFVEKNNFKCNYVEDTMCKGIFFKCIEKDDNQWCDKHEMIIRYTNDICVGYTSLHHEIIHLILYLVNKDADFDHADYELWKKIEPQLEESFIKKCKCR